MHTLGDVIQPWDVNERVLERENDNEYESIYVVRKSLLSLFKEFSSSGDVVSAVWTVEIMILWHLYLLQHILMTFLVFYIAPTSLVVFLQMFLFTHVIFSFRSIIFTARFLCCIGSYNTF